VEVVVVAAGSYMADVGGLRYRERLKGQLMTSEQAMAEPMMVAIEHSEQPVIERKPRPSRGVPKGEGNPRTASWPESPLQHRFGKLHA